MKKIAVILSGCGFKDGAEITESISTLIVLSEKNINYRIFAPNINFTPKNHRDDSSEQERNVLTESSRIARGEIEDLDQLQENDFDAIIFPGGYGAALNLSNWAEKGSKANIHPKVSEIIQSFYKASKPIGALCIAPTLLALELGSENIEITIGNDFETAKEIEKTGAHHIECKVSDFLTDREHKLITSPAYMYDATAFEVFTGIRKAILEIIEMA